MVSILSAVERVSERVSGVLENARVPSYLVGQILNIIREHGTISFLSLYKEAGIPVIALEKILLELKREKLVRSKGPLLCLNERIKRLLPVCKPVPLRYVKQICLERVPISPLYSQLHVDEKALLERARLISTFIYSKEQKIIILGDDDALSLIVGSMLPKNKIIVLEIDSRIVNWINKMANSMKLNVQAYPYDARKTPDPNFIGIGDLFFSDPPYTANGIRLFAGRGIQLTKKNGVLILSASPKLMNEETEAAFQKFVLENHLIEIQRTPYQSYEFPETLRRKLRRLNSLTEIEKYYRKAIENKMFLDVWYLSTGRAESLAVLLKTAAAPTSPDVGRYTTNIY